MKTVPILLTMFLAMSLGACTPGFDEPSYTPPAIDPGENPDAPVPPARRVKLTVGSAVFTATLARNAAAAEFGAMLPMSVGMGELNGNEKYYYLPHPLPVSASYPGTVHSGDILLFGADCLVVFYETFSTPYGYTPLGSVDDTSGFAAALGAGSINVKFELTNE